MNNQINLEWELLVTYDEFQKNQPTMSKSEVGETIDEQEIQNWISMSNYMGMVAGAIRTWAAKLDRQSSLYKGLHKIYKSLVVINNGKRNDQGEWIGGFIEAIKGMRDGHYPPIKIEPAPIDEWKDDSTADGIKQIVKPLLKEIIKRIGSEATGVYGEIVFSINVFVNNVDAIL